eukprot:TRINITY_DN7057_c0_g1_i1.p1 TRINITY_DN7057_c0_g1~~TRINITY_DN7057_c0_g1_i1.p1  ORF type:complete len:331 (+),score=56.79 TRINITY_DN7057_c0_g1_i1:16-1008(+)
MTQGSVLLLVFLQFGLIWTQPRGIVNSYCGGSACPLSIIQQDRKLINSVSVLSYRLNSSGLIEACSATTQSCTFDGIVQEFNKNIHVTTQGEVRVVPLIFNNDGTTIANFRTMIKQKTSQNVIDYITNEAKMYGYNAISMDWEPSCWDKDVTKCLFPSFQDAGMYNTFLQRLGSSLKKIGVPLVVCADHETCTIQCNGDRYLERCKTGNATWAECNCCAFQTWFHAPSLCDDLSNIDVISVMDTYADAPFNQTWFRSAAQPWFDAGCTPDRISLGLFPDEANVTNNIDLMFSTLDEMKIRSVDIWVNMWQSNATTLWKKQLAQFIEGSVI